MIKNTITYSELVILLTWIKGKAAFEGMDLDSLKNELDTKDFKWEQIHRTAIAMEYAGIGEKSAQLTDADFEDIFETTLEVFSLIDVKEIEDKLRNFSDYDMVEKIGGRLGFDFTINEEVINKELEKLHNYINIIDNIFMTYNFMNPILSDKQLKKLEDELANHIQNERYEECSVLQEKIKEIKKENI